MIEKTDVMEDIGAVRRLVYDNCSMNITNLVAEHESREYKAFSFQLNEFKVIARTAKITPKKVGQFVVVWKRIGDGPIQPFDEQDSIEFAVINVRRGEEFGQFVFPQAILLTKGICSNGPKEGKRAFRVYPPWDEPTSKQAVKSQGWQLEFFLRLDGEVVDLERARQLYGG